MSHSIPMTISSSRWWTLCGVSAVLQAAGHEAGHPGSDGGAREGTPGAGTDAERAHARTQAQVRTRRNSHVNQLTELEEIKNRTCM